MKKTVIALALVASSLPALAQKAPEPEFAISGNFGLFSDYRFRGISQTDGKMAAQGGLDLAHKSGAYIGAWTTNVGDWANSNGNGQEIDIYGGFKFQAPMGVTLDIGALKYVYPGSGNMSTGFKPDTLEYYLGASYSVLSYKFSRSSGRLFAATASDGSTYHDLTAKFSFNDQVSAVAHYGLQTVKGSGNPTYSDYKVGLGYALPDGFAISLDYVGNTGLSTTEQAIYTNGSGKKLYDPGVVFALTKTF